ncbi:restriction endonuclease subunit S [Clostridium perfringens]|uniref:Restriction modification system DNA specificity domain-containing protein n=1 Tax=Clostridium perfringens TaxID=1502 RepID=A0A2X3CD10_CLOPF|nr:restriction endonuclease subunit S [Clostridium perfringens]EJT6499439.1 restriction endonuclease subunit S [Clostridium perfringens]MDK0885798.1 restriction endonuclease subunit S [Clostridium perfringens]SQC06225.1 restriction modification system DNA specificity domain-containing protein [Clostridium perfringens]
MEKFRIDEITINLDNLRKPLNSQQRKEMSKKKLYPYYGANNLMDYIDEYIFDEEILCVAEDGGSWGYKEKCSYIVNEKCWVNNHAHILKAKENLNLKYLMYYLNYNDLSNRITGTTRGKLTKSALNSIEVKLPSIEKQKKIVALLEKAQELIDKRKKQIEELDLLVKSKFLEMFGDQNTNSKNLEKVYLKDISELITKGASPNWQGIEYVDDDTQTLFVTSENVREGYIDLSKKKYLMDAFNEKQKRSILNNGDFLINIVGASIGRAAQFNLDIKANINQAVALVRIKKGLVNDKYMLEYLNSPKALQMYKSMQVSVARANLSLQNINDLEILLPPMELQNQFANFVKQVDKLKFKMEKSLKELEENFNSLMQKIFKVDLL